MSINTILYLPPDGEYSLPFVRSVRLVVVRERHRAHVAVHQRPQDALGISQVGHGDLPQGKKQGRHTERQARGFGVKIQQFRGRSL